MEYQFYQDEKVITWIRKPFTIDAASKAEAIMIAQQYGKKLVEEDFDDVNFECPEDNSYWRLSEPSKEEKPTLGVYCCSEENFTATACIACNGDGSFVN